MAATNHAVATHSHDTSACMPMGCMVVCLDQGKDYHLEDHLWPVEVLICGPKVPGDVGSIGCLVILKLHRKLLISVRFEALASSNTLGLQAVSGLVI